MLQPEDIDWMNGNKNRTCTYAAYKRLTSHLRHIPTESEGMEKAIPMQMEIERKPKWQYSHQTK